MVGPCGSRTTRPACGSSCAYPGGRPTADPSEEAAPWAMTIGAGITEPLGARIIEAPISRPDERVATALAHLGGMWPAMTVTAALSECADAALTGAVGFLFREAAARGQWSAQGDGRVSPAGYIVLAMGKFGAGEVNYSSDVDLIVFYD